MDPLSENFELYSPKIEPDIDTDTDSKDAPTPTPAKRAHKIKWGYDETIQLIESLSKECQELWDTKHPSYKDRAAKQTKQDYLADKFCTTTEEIGRKVHNLRTQFNAELRKIKRRRTDTGYEDTSAQSRWEYFESLSFLLPTPSADDTDLSDPFADIPTDTSYKEETVNIDLAQFQTEEEGVYGPAVEAQNAADAVKVAEETKKRKEPPTPLSRILAALARLVENAPPPSPVPLSEPRRLRSRVAPDDCQIFGDFVASELRMLRTDQARSKLKRLIQTSILQVGKDEDRWLHQNAQNIINKQNQNSTNQNNFNSHQNNQNFM